VNIGFSSGYLENYWGTDWHNATMLGGSERILVEVAVALAALGHSVTARLPYACDTAERRGVRWIGSEAGPQTYDVLFCFDDYQRHDDAARTALVACRSDPPEHTDFDELVFLSGTHARLLGHPGRPFVGGGVDLDAYRVPLPRIPRRVICTSSPDRCPQAAAIGRTFDFVHTYKPVPGYRTSEVSRQDLVRIQSTALALIYPLDPVRPSDFFSMAVLESMAAGTPVVVSDADSMAELWSEAAIVLPLPVNLSEWYLAVDELLNNPVLWKTHSLRGKHLAKQYDWRSVARKYLEIASA